MSADLVAVRAGLDEILRAGVPAPWRVYRSIPLIPDPPAVVIGVPELVEYDASLGGTAAVSGVVTLVIAVTDAAFDLLDAALSPATAGTVVGVLDDARHDAWSGGLAVARASNTRPVQIGSTTLVAIDLELELEC